MGKIVNLMEDAFEKNANDGERLVDEQFMMNIFEPIVNQVDPFAEYLEYSRQRRLMSFAPETSMTSGCHLMNYEQNCSFRLVTMYAKHMILLAAWQKLQRLCRMLNSGITLITERCC